MNCLDSFGLDGKAPFEARPFGSPGHGQGRASVRAGGPLSALGAVSHGDTLTVLGSVCNPACW
jgi:hypothetical protein